jgi:hypothetical protein
MAKQTAASQQKECPYTTRDGHLPADLRKVLSRAAFERARIKTNHASVSGLVMAMVEKNPRALQLGKTVR